jgi:hypothetical protein
MTGTNFAALIREYTRTNSTTLTDATIVLLANTVKEDFAPEIMKADEDLFGVPATRNLIASAISREYSLPEDNLKLIRVEAKFDGTNWVKLHELNLALYRRTTDEATITRLFNNSEMNAGNPSGAQYDIFRKALWLYSATIEAVTAGLKLYYIAYPADIVAGDLAGSTDLSIDPTTTTSQIPRQFHELWARKVSIMWKSNREKPIPLNERELFFEKDFKKKISSITNPNQDRDNEAKLPDDTHLQN